VVGEVAHVVLEAEAQAERHGVVGLPLLAARRDGAPGEVVSTREPSNQGGAVWPASHSGKASQCVATFVNYLHFCAIKDWVVLGLYA